MTSACVLPRPLQVVANVVLPQVLARATAPSNPAAQVGSEASGKGGVIAYIVVTPPLNGLIRDVALCAPFHGPVIVWAMAQGAYSKAKRAAKLRILFKCDSPSLRYRFVNR